MEYYEFLLDFSGNAAIPSQYKITKKDVCKQIQLQAKGYRDIQLTDHYHRGCYSISTGDKKTAEFLKTFVLEIKWKGKPHRVPLKPATPDKPKIWVRFWGTCIGVMSQLSNSYFDKIVEEAGFNILKPTEKRTHYGSTIYNGQRSALCQRGASHIEREHEWIDEEGNVFKWRLEYDGQPHQCTRGCNTYHEDGKCATWEKKKEERSWGGQQKCFFVASSMLRLAADTKETRVDCIPGAKVGHLANHLNNDTTIFSDAKVIAIHAGANMDLGSVEESKPQFNAQVEELVKVVKPLVEADKSVFIVDPVAGPLVMEAPGSDHWAMVRSRMKKAAKEAKSHWVSLQNLDWIAEEDIDEDGIHYSKSGTVKVMEAVAEKVKNVTGIDPIAGMEFQDKQYKAIYRNHYKFGCYKCTRIHERGACPSLPIDNNDSINSELNNSSSDNDDQTSHNATHAISDEESFAIGDATIQEDAGFVTDIVSDHPEQRLSLSGTPSTASSRGSNKGHLTPHPMKNFLKENRERSSSASKREREANEDASDNSQDKNKRAKANDKKANRSHVPRAANDKGAKK